MEKIIDDNNAIDHFVKNEQRQLIFLVKLQLTKCAEYWYDIIIQNRIKHIKIKIFTIVTRLSNCVNHKYMNDFKTRLHTERDELDQKIVKLEDFIAKQKTAKDKTVSKEHFKMLKKQLKIMKQYSHILKRRIEDLGN